MKTEKITLTITMETLSMDSFETLIWKFCDSWTQEMITGELNAEDGDCVKWEIERLACEI